MVAIVGPILRKITPELYERLFVLKSALWLAREGQLKEDGWFKSLRAGRCQNSNGEAIPWITYPAIAFIEKRLKNEFSVFEYGSGASTKWWAARVKEVVSCEHDEEWAKIVEKDLPENASLLYLKLEYGGDYSKAVSAQKKLFDIIVVDGRDRVNCALNSYKSLRDGGVIIWDNSDRERYQEGIRTLETEGFKRIDFEGMAPLITAKSVTSIFYRKENCLEI